MTNQELSHKWNVSASELQTFQDLLYKHHARLAWATFRVALTVLRPEDVNAKAGSVEDAASKSMAKAGIVISPTLIAIIFGVLGIAVQVLGPQIKPFINQIITILNGFLPMPIPPIP